MTPPLTVPHHPRRQADRATTRGQEHVSQLLVAQIKNQDPMSPSDGAQFLANGAVQQLSIDEFGAGSVGHPQRSGPAGTDLRHRGRHIYHQLIGDIHVHIVFDGSFRAQRHLHGG